MTDKRLASYRDKRNFKLTGEPEGRGALGSGSRFVVHKHHASQDHYDLRLELDGVLKSWAVPKGPSLNPAEKRLAMNTEDHPVEYLDFEGIIPAGEYGGGPMIVWDQGEWAPMGDPIKDLQSGAFKFRLAGEKLKGGWMLARLKPRAGETQESWLLIKEHDAGANAKSDVLRMRPESVKSGLRIEELGRRQKPAPKKSRPQKLEKIAGAIAGEMPARISPQLATPADTPPVDHGTTHWLHEIKFDGYRTLAFVEDGKARLIMRVARFEFGYMAARRTQGGSKPPPRADKLIPEYIAAVDDLGPTSGRLIIGGKSMGNRVASMAADSLYEAGRIAGLLCLAYPFHPPAKPDQLRTAHLSDLKTPTLICQGTRDEFGTRDEVSGYLLSPAIKVLWLEDGDHDLKPRKSISGFSTADHLKTMATSMKDWALSLS